MSIEEIRSVRNAEPFQRFTMILKNGSRLLVEHQRAVSWSPSGNLVAIDVGGAFQFVAPTEIAEVQMSPPFPGRRAES
jgi:hypothetical protein